MDSEAAHDETKNEAPRLGRSWTERFSGPIRYRRYTGNDSGGRPHIFFKFEPSPEGKDIPPEVYAILKELKYLDSSLSPGKGRSLRPTGLHFNRDRDHGRVWKMPDSPVARVAADIIDAKLMDLACDLDGHHR